jgi:hypothetical protein
MSQPILCHAVSWERSKGGLLGTRARLMAFL